jgi:hypothetical protein
MALVKYQLAGLFPAADKRTNVPRTAYCAQSIPTLSRGCLLIKATLNGKNAVART